MGKIVWEWLKWLWRMLLRTPVEAVTNFTATSDSRITAFTTGITYHSFFELFTKGTFYMERYRASWNPSPSTFVEKLQIVGVINGAPEAVLVDNLPSSAFEAFFNVNIGDDVECWCRAVGDNATTADSLHVTFKAANEQKVAPVEDFGVAWQSHVP
jgi:hypothetical protein